MVRLKPWLLLDIDGVLNPYRNRGALHPRSRWKSYKLNKHEVWLREDHGAMILDAVERGGFELVWCTTWEHDANDMISCRIGLPNNLPVIEFGFTAIQWKFTAVAQYAEGRPVWWFDDDFHKFPSEREWFDRHRGETPTALYHVDPSVGLEQSDLEAAVVWGLNHSG